MERMPALVELLIGQAMPRLKHIFFETSDGQLISLDAKTATLTSAFGTGGAVDMKAGVMNGFETGRFSLSSPPQIL
jgi:glucose dehydrogenase